VNVGSVSDFAFGDRSARFSPGGRSCGRDVYTAHDASALVRRRLLVRRAGRNGRIRDHVAREGAVVGQVDVPRAMRFVAVCAVARVRLSVLTFLDRSGVDAAVSLLPVLAVLPGG
jgi:hypothetical protein